MGTRFARAVGKAGARPHSGPCNARRGLILDEAAFGLLSLAQELDEAMIYYYIYMALLVVVLVLWLIIAFQEDRNGGGNP